MQCNGDDIMDTKGRIHSFETFGTVDGPGIRFVVFMQGCNFKCQYCHNPDTWKCEGGELYSAQEVFNKVIRYKTYFKNSGGGLTVSGGEPLNQIDFITELFRLCKEDGIHTTLDTNGFIASDNPKIAILMEYTDLVLLDIKHMDNDKHIELTGLPNDQVLFFARYLSTINKPTWIRHVLVPGITDDDRHILKLKRFLDSLTNIQKVELLPFHKIGEYKWKELNMDYKLYDVPPASDNDVDKVIKLLG